MSSVTLKRENLSSKDLAFMIRHLDDFSFVNRNYIFFHKDEWMKIPDVKRELEDEMSELNKADNTRSTLKKTILNSCGVSAQYIVSNLDNAPSDTAEALHGLLMHINSSSFFNYFDKIEDSYKDMVRAYVMEIVLPEKTEAYTVFKKSQYDIKPSSDREFDMIINYERYLLQEFTNHKINSGNIKAVFLYLYLKAIGIDNKEIKNANSIIDTFPFFIQYEAMYDKINSGRFVYTLERLFSGKDFLKVTNEFKEVAERISIPEDLLNTANSKLSVLYNEEKKISKITPNDLFIGDELLINGDRLTVNDIRAIIYQLDDDNIRKYIGPKVISYDVSEKEAGAIKSEGYPLLKYLTNEEGFKTLTQFNGDIYLLFHIIGDNTLYGISSKDDPITKERKLCKIDLPSDRHWELVTK